jgi:hypothetical protein
MPATSMGNFPSLVAFIIRKEKALFQMGRKAARTTALPDPVSLTSSLSAGGSGEHHEGSVLLSFPLHSSVPFVGDRQLFKGSVPLCSVALVRKEPIPPSWSQGTGMILESPSGVLGGLKLHQRFWIRIDPWPGFLSKSLAV